MRRRAHALARALRRAAARTGLLEGRCPCCGDAAPCGGPHGLCPACATLLAPRTGGYCPTCGALFGLESYEPSTCGDCRASPPPWERFVFHAHYGQLLREIIVAYKYEGRLTYAALLRSLAAAAWTRAATDPGAFEAPPARPDLAVPVPLHPRRLLWRGFNQSQELALGVARATGARTAPSALVRTRDTAPQSTLRGKERLNNLRGAFLADPVQVRGRQVLLVDDVCTTGATLRECAKALRKQGASGIDVLVLARA